MLKIPNTQQESISVKTLQEINESISNYKNGNVSDSINLSDFEGKKNSQHFFPYPLSDSFCIFFSLIDFNQIQKSIGKL